MAFSVDDMLDLQKELHARYADRWEPLEPGTGKHSMLWMIGEIGEVADIVKKHGEEAALQDPALRHALVEEMADVLMYYADVMLCYGISSDELEHAWREKHARNLERW